jgi:hypothetical protein
MPFDGRGKAAGEPTGQCAAVQIRGMTLRSVVHTSSAGLGSWDVGRAIARGSNAPRDVRTCYRAREPTFNCGGC